MRPRVLLFVAPLLVGCYVYRPLGSAAPRPGSLVRASLTEAGSDELRAQVGPQVAAIDGRVVSAASQPVMAEPLVLGVTQTTNHSGTEQDWKGERVAIPRSAIASLRERTLSRGRTALATGAVVTALIATVRAFVVKGGGGDPPPGGPPGRS